MTVSIDKTLLAWFGLAGKAALVTGANVGIGRGIAPAQLFTEDARMEFVFDPRVGRTTIASGREQICTLINAAQACR
jgi:NAD(P)-dependent dehydrogenase (short-subunit alcohol dehydrogenase family)